MTRFKSILLVCDERSVHEALINRAIRLAKANDASVTLADVVEAEPGELAKLFGALPGARAQDVEFEVVEFHRDRLAQLAAPIKSEGIETSEVVLQGVPFVEIIRRVLSHGHDLVMKGAAGESEGQSLLFASTDLHLMRKCPCPVWVMKRSQERQYARILAAVDPDLREQQRIDLNTLIMDLATSISAADGSALHVVHTWKLEEEETLRHSGIGRVAKSEVDLLVNERRLSSERGLQELLVSYPADGSDREVHLLKGSARELVPELAKKLKAELIVMGTVARTGIQGLIIGNTAEAILNQVDCSVLAVKPPGFESPVRLEESSAPQLSSVRP